MLYTDRSIFLDEEIDMENFLDLSESELQNIISKIGHWNLLCRSRADFLAQKDPVDRQIPEQDVKQFLNDVGLNSSAYIAAFEGNFITNEQTNA